jgi:phage gp29-like protein
MQETFEVNGTRYRVRDKDLATKQTDDSPRIAQLRREFAEHPSSGLTPAKLSAILIEAEQGNMIAQCYLAEDIEEKDGHIYAELFKRKAALAGVPFEIQPPINASAQEQKDADNIEQILRGTIGWHELIFNMADGILKGFSNIEIEWGRNHQGLHTPKSFEHIPATFFQLHQHDQRQIVLRNDTGFGEPLRPFGWIQHRHAAKSGYPARQGLVRQLSWPFIFKNYSVRDLAEFLEIYGIPAKIGKYPAGATPTEKQRLLQAVLSIGHNAGGIIPKGMEIEFAEAAKGGGSDPFMTMMSWCERTQSKAILGQTLTAEAGNVGSQALGNVHNDVRIEIRDHDLDQIQSTLNRDLVDPLHMLNGKSYNGDPMRKPRLVFDTQEPEDIALYSEAMPKLVSIGVQVPLSYVQQKLRIPMPENGEPILAVAPVTPVGAASAANKDPDKAVGANTTAALKLALAALKSNGSKLVANSSQLDNDAADIFTAKLKAKVGESFSTIMQPIEQMVANAESLPQLLEDLLALESQLDASDYQEVLAQAFAAAELAGRFEVSEGQ